MWLSGLGVFLGQTCNIRSLAPCMLSGSCDGAGGGCSLLLTALAMGFEVNMNSCSLNKFVEYSISGSLVAIQYVIYSSWAFCENIRQLV